MKNLILRKRFTINYLFVLIGIIFLLSFSNICSAQKKNTPETYKSYIKQADMAFEASDFKKALEFYEKANLAKPEYSYPTFKIDEIKKILDANADPKKQTSHPINSNASYKSILAKADYEYNNKDFATALLFYDKAAKTKPEYAYAYDKMDEINAILNAAPETKTRIFENTIQKAENFYELKDYQQAKSEYEKAALIDTASRLPIDRLQQISAVYTDPEDMGNFKLAIANGDKELASNNYDHAILFYEAALQMHPKAKFVNSKITDAKNQQIANNAKITLPAIAVASADKAPQSEIALKASDPEKIAEAGSTSEAKMQLEQTKYDTTLAAAENSLKSGDYEAALAGYKSASALKPFEKDTQLKITEIEKMQAEKTLQKETDENYTAAITNGDKFLSASKYKEALVAYKQASSIKPDEHYPAEKIADINTLLAKQKSDSENYTAAINSGDKFLSASKYNEALGAYKQASSIKPDENYPAEKIAEINTLLAKQKSDSENYAQAIRTGEKAMAAGNYSLALTSFQNAEKIKPSETYPKQEIIEIKAKIAAQQDIEEKYTLAINSGDQLYANKKYNAALDAYTGATQLKKNEKYPQDQIVRINKIISDSRTVDDDFTIAIKEGDKLFGMKDYSGALSVFSKASALKPSEAYPVQRIAEINKIAKEMKLSRSAEYNKAIEDADKLYSAKIFDQAIEAYETAFKINPGDAYPELQINKIRKYMSDHAILDLNSQVLTIRKGTEKKFTFSAIDPSLRKNDYILIKARSTSESIPKVYLSYGKDNTKNGGIVLRSIDKSTLMDLLISISIQDKWFREENNWLSISVETGEIEITRVQIAAGE